MQPAVYLHAMIIVALATEVDADVIMTVMTVYFGVLALIGMDEDDDNDQRRAA